MTSLKYSGVDESYCNETVMAQRKKVPCITDAFAKLMIQLKER